jgi:hypothetical protein
MKYKVTFEDVGRYKLSWTVELANIGPAALVRAVKSRKGALASKAVEAVDGHLFAGGRIVGFYSTKETEN